MAAEPTRVDKAWNFVVKGLGGFIALHSLVLRAEPSLVIGLVGIAVASLPTDQLVAIIRLFIGRRNGNGSSGEPH